MNQGCWKVDENDEASTSSTFYKRDKHHHFSHELWNELYSAKSTGTKAVYIDLEEEDEQRDDNREYSQWHLLPDIILEQIFSHLSIREKYYASLVCKSWYNAFYLPQVWAQFILEDNTLTRARFNYYSGWHYVLDHLRTQNCLYQVGCFFKSLIVKPMLNFYNLYEFMNMISWCQEQAIKDANNPQFNVGHNIECLKFTFPCDMTTTSDTNSNEQDEETDQSADERTRLFGTGGKLLAGLKRLMKNLKQLKRLELIDLMLEAKEAQNLLDEVCDTCCQTLKHLTLINTTRVHYELFPIGVFINLHTLQISPQSLGDDLVEMLSWTKLRHLHIVQNRYTSKDVNYRPVSPKVWKSARRNNANLRVHLHLESLKEEKPLIWQENAPVSSVLYDSPCIRLRPDSLMTAVEFYKDTLTIYGHKNIPNVELLKMDEEIASSLLILVRECPQLVILIVNDVVSTLLALILAYSAKNLQQFYIRRDAVTVETCSTICDAYWSDEICNWLKSASGSVESTEIEIAQLLGKQNWRFLSDEEFKKIDFNF